MVRTIVLFSALAGVLLAGGCSSQMSATQATYESPEAAVDAMSQAVDTRDREELRRVFGPRLSELRSGDPVQDDEDMQRLAAALQRGYRLEDAGQGAQSVLIGPDGWLFPVPLVQANGRWRFDTDAGIEEVMDRRVGRNELDAIAMCKYLVAAQEVYFQMDPDRDGVRSYAVHLASTPGKQDGLYWPAADDEVQSPIGPLVVAALERGQLKQVGGSGARQPYRGYFYKVLTRQGPAAPGGEMNYVDSNGRMTGGFALLAWPAEHERSGVMTFLVGRDGKIYQANLGKNTPQEAEAMASFDPDSKWQRLDSSTTAQLPNQ